MRRIGSLLLGLVMALGSAAAVVAQADYIDVEPAPVGTAIRHDPAQVMVTVISVTVTDDPASLIEHFDPVEVAPGDAGILVALAMTNGEDEAFRPAFAFGWRLVDAGGTERLMPYGTCGDAATDWLASGNIRRDRTATITVCWTLPPTLLDGALMEMRYAAGAGRYDPFSIEPPSAATPVALPAAQRETHRAGAGHPAPGFNPPLSSPV